MLFTILSVISLLRGEGNSPTARRKPRRPERRARLGVEALEERCCPAPVSMYWDPTSGNNASTVVMGFAVNWDTGSLGSGTHPTAAPGNTNGELDSIYFDGHPIQNHNNNSNCTWDYNPTYALGALSFQNHWTQTVSFLDKDGLAVTSNSSVNDTSAPTITPNGNSGANAVPAIELQSGVSFTVSSGGTLSLRGWSSGNAIFFVGNGTAGEILKNNGTVSYTGVSAMTAHIDYLLVPVQNNGLFKVNGGFTSGQGTVLQVAGADTTNTSGVSFYQSGSNAETDISGGGTLWCVNDFKMTAGLLQTKDSLTEYLMVGTSGSSPVDGTVSILGGGVMINPGMKVYGTLDIVGTTGADVPTLNVGSANLMFKVNMTTGSNQCDQLIVGDTSGTGKVNFGYNSGTTTVDLNAQGATTPGHKWEVIFFGNGKRTGDVTLQPPTGFKKNWTNPTYLEIDSN